MHKSSRGFTIVELLIVIVVIGILAAIVIIAFNGIQGRANDTAVRSDLKGLATKLEIFKNDPQHVGFTGNYPTSTTQLGYLTFKATKNSYDISQINLMYCYAPGGGEYSFLALTKSGKKLYINSSVNGIQEYSGTDTWLTTNYSARCQTASPTTTSFSAGYNLSDTSTGPWRVWTGVAN